MEFYSISDIADMSNQSQKNIRRYIAAGRLKADKIGGKYRILKDDYEKWMAGDTAAEKENIFTEAMPEKSDCTVNWIDISDKWCFDGWLDKEYRNGYNFIDLFAGAGGLGCGLTMAGFTPVGSVEIMPEAVATYKYNFIEKKGFAGKAEPLDIREEETKNSLYSAVFRCIG